MRHSNSNISEYLFLGKSGFIHVTNLCIMKKYNGPLELLKQIQLRMDQTGETQIFSSPAFKSILIEYFDKKYTNRELFCNFVIKRWSSIFQNQIKKCKKQQHKEVLLAEQKRIITWLHNNRIYVSDFLVLYSQIRLLECIS